MGEYLALGTILAVGGSWMVPRAAVRDGAFGRIEELIRAAVEAVAAC
jgi:2-dehydro-3-deoxyphosphogluconate aldolase/(4S)-4-hydroxy-2-oxoglutarate aldolase